MHSLNFYRFLMILIFTGLSSISSLFSQNILGEPPIDDFLSDDDKKRNRTVVELVYQDIKSFHLYNLYLDTLLE